MVRSDLPRALAALRDPRAPASARAEAIEVARSALALGGLPARAVRDTTSALHHARSADPAGGRAAIDALAAGVGVTLAPPEPPPVGAWGLSALLAEEGVVARADLAAGAGERWQVDCADASRARALVARLERAGPADTAWRLEGARVEVTRRATQRSATAHWQEVGAWAPPLDARGRPRPLTDDDVAAALDRHVDELAAGALLDDGALSQGWIDLVDYVHGAADSGVRAVGLPALRRVVTAGADLAFVPAIMVDDIGALAAIVHAAAAELGHTVEATRVTTDDDSFTVRAARATGGGRRDLATRLAERLQEAGYGHELHVRPRDDGWEGQIQIYTSRARIEELARANLMLLHYLPAAARVVYLGRAGGSAFFTHHVERTLAGAPADARVFVLSRHTAPPRLVARTRALIDAAVYGDGAPDRAFSVAARYGKGLDALVLDGLDAAARADPALAADVQSLHDLAHDAGLLDGLGDGAELLIVDERGHGTFPLMLRHALERAPRPRAPSVRAAWLVGGNRTAVSDYPRLDPARLAADFGWASPGRVIEALSRQAEHVPQPLAGPRYRGRDVAPLGQALELDSPRVRAGVLVKNLWLYHGWVRGHAELALAPLAAARDDARAPPELRALAGHLLAEHLGPYEADLYGIAVT